jgi:translation initiation factor IF-3
MAREANLDLVEVSPMSTPPVCRIMDYGKWKYQQHKKEQKNKTQSKQSELKGVRLRPKIDVHDLAIKLQKARSFLNDGHKVQFTMIFRGREMAHRELGHQTMQKVRDDLGDLSKVESVPRMMHRRMTMVLAPDRSGKKTPAVGGEPRPAVMIETAAPKTSPA